MCLLLRLTQNWIDHFVITQIKRVKVFSYSKLSDFSISEVYFTTLLIILVLENVYPKGVSKMAAKKVHLLRGKS